MRRLFEAPGVWISLELVGTCQSAVLWFLFLPEFGAFVSRSSLRMTGLHKQVRSICSMVRLCIFVFESKVCFAPSTFLPDATLLQLYNFMERSWFQRRKNILFLLLLKKTFTSNGRMFNGSENSLLAQHLELWLLNTSKNSLTNQRLQCLCGI